LAVTNTGGRRRRPSVRARSGFACRCRPTTARWPSCPARRDVSCDCLKLVVGVVEHLVSVPVTDAATDLQGTSRLDARDPASPEPHQGDLVRAVEQLGFQCYRVRLRAELHTTNPPQNGHGLTSATVAGPTGAARPGTFGQLVGVEFARIAGQFPYQFVEVTTVLGGHWHTLLYQGPPTTGPCAINRNPTLRKRNPTATGDTRRPNCCAQLSCCGCSVDCWAAMCSDTDSGSVIGRGVPTGIGEPPRFTTVPRTISRSAPGAVADCDCGPAITPRTSHPGPSTPTKRNATSSVTAESSLSHSPAPDVTLAPSERSCSVSLAETSRHDPPGRGAA